VTSGGILEGGWLILGFDPAVGFAGWPPVEVDGCAAGPPVVGIDFAELPAGVVDRCVDEPLVAVDEGMDVGILEPPTELVAFDVDEPSAGLFDFDVTGPPGGVVTGVWGLFPPDGAPGAGVRVPASPGAGRFTCCFAGGFFCLSCGFSSPLVFGRLASNEKPRPTASMRRFNSFIQVILL